MLRLTNVQSLLIQRNILSTPLSINSINILLLRHDYPPSPLRSNISTSTAINLLGLSGNANKLFTRKELRHAYLEAAKKCHPDTSSSRNTGDNDNNVSKETTTTINTTASSTKLFCDITDAYEELLQRIKSRPYDDNDDNNDDDDDDDNWGITYDEEDHFRHACQTHLGVSAEIVEECKENAAFRQWLEGNTDSAHHWRIFLMHHGGMAPMLKKKKVHLLADDKATLRRRRKS